MIHDAGNFPTVLPPVSVF